MLFLKIALIAFLTPVVIAWWDRIGRRDAERAEARRLASQPPGLVDGGVLQSEGRAKHTADPGVSLENVSRLSDQVGTLAHRDPLK